MLNRSDPHWSQTLNNFTIGTYFLGSFYEGNHWSSKIQNNCVLHKAIFALLIGFFKERVSVALETAQLDIRAALTAVQSSDHCEEKLDISLWT